VTDGAFDDDVADRLDTLWAAFGGELADVAEVGSKLDHGALLRWLEPTTPNAAAVCVADFGTELGLVIGHRGEGGRWELKRNVRQVDFVEDVARSVVAGRVVETIVPGRSTMTVTLADGTTAREIAMLSLRGLLPGARWSRSRRTIDYAPYS
jgi:hypothetical protein